MSEAERTPGPEAPEAVRGLTNARAVSLDRAPIRTREAGVTLSAWRLSVESDQGQGAIVLVTVSAAEVFYRGEGVFLGWEAEDLRAAYETLRPQSEEPPPQIPQLG